MHVYPNAACMLRIPITCVCSLVQRRERFKFPRARAKAYECAKRLRGVEPMLEYFFSKAYVGPRRPRHGAHWKSHVMLTNVPPPSRREEQWGALNNPVGPRSVMLEEDCKLLGSTLDGGAYPLRVEPHWLDVYYMIDGFTVYDCRKDPSIGNMVYVREGENLPTYLHKDCGQGPASKTVSKYHYLMLVGPGGVLLCAAMRSASTLCVII